MIEVLILFLSMQKLSALSASLARVVSTAEEEEAQLDQFPVEGVRKVLDRNSRVSFNYAKNRQYQKHSQNNS